MIQATPLRQPDFKPDLEHQLQIHPDPIRTALTIRRTEERFLQLFQQGRIFGTVHTCIGQEWTGIAIAEALQEGDFIVSNHRCHGHYLAWTNDVDGLVAEVMGRANGTCGGRGGSQHLCRDSFFSNGVQGGMAPVAAGMAYARKTKGRQAIGTLFIGDGTLGEGTLYESLNLISKWSLPLVVVLENNLYSQSTSQSETLAGSICARAEAFGIESMRADTWDWEDLLTRTQQAIGRVRETNRPLFLEIATYRLAPHSKGDDNRSPAEISSFSKRDPLNLLLEHGGELVETMVREIDARLDGAIDRAEAAGWQAVTTTAAGPARVPTWSQVAFSEARVVKQIRDCLEAAMHRDPSIVIVGEDVRSPYGGAFKATQGLSDAFPDRVHNAPISEASIVGFGTGVALEGGRPIVEIMFGDFVTLASDQIINHAAKFRWMYNDQVRVPLIIRTPMGGKRGYGPTHSQSLEKHVLGVPGTEVLALHHRFSPELVYRTLIETVEVPTIVIENKIGYGQLASPRVLDGYRLEATNTRFPTIRVAPIEGTAEMTIVTYGGMVAEAEAALLKLFLEHEVLCELIVPLQLYPLDLAPIAESAVRTGKVLLVEEGQGFAGFGAEVLAQLAESGLHILAKRVVPAAHPIPSARPLEEHALPGQAQIVLAVQELLRG